MGQLTNDTIYRDSLNTPLIRTKQPGPDAWWKRRWLIPSLVIVLLATVSFMAVSYVKAAGVIEKVGCIHCVPDGASSVSQPTGVAVDAAGNLYLVNSNRNLVQKFDSAGKLLLQFGSGGNGNAQFSAPLAVATDSSGNVYVTDKDNNRVQKFNSSGTYVSEFGSNGSGDGQLNSPKGIAIDSSGNIYVADGGNSRVQKFNSSGVYQAQFGTNGSGDGQFSGLQGLALDSSGNLYAADSGNYRIQKFDTSGTFVSKFGTSGHGNGELYGAYGVALDSSGNIYVADGGNNRVQKFNSSGVYQAQWGSSYSSYGDANGEMSSPSAIAVDDSYNVYVADMYNDRAQKFTNTGEFVLRLGTAGITPYGGWAAGYGNGEFNSPVSAAFDSSSNVYVVDSENHRVQKFDASGNFLNRWQSASVGSYGKPANGTAPGEFDNPFGISVDSNDNLYVADTGNNRIQKFNASGTYVTAFGGSGPYGGGSGDGQLALPYGVTNDLAGNVYVADTFNNRIQKFSSSGTYITKTGEVSGSQVQQQGISAQEGSGGPMAVTVDSAGNVWAVDMAKIYKYSSSLAFIQSWDLVSMASTNEGLDVWNFTLTADTQGHIYVTQMIDGQSGRVAKFDLNGNQLDTWNTPSSNTMLIGLGADPSRAGRLAAPVANQNQVLFLCDTSVSTNNCSSATPTPSPSPTPTPDVPHGGGGGDSATTTYFYPNTTNSSVTYLALGGGTVTNGSLSETKYANLPKDGPNLYPAGLSSFQFDVDPGATTQVALYYNLPGKPSNYTARKYNPSTQTYTDISGATITREDYSGTSMLKLTYNLTDNGILDLDPAPGHVVDPVGLATTSLASTGENIWVIALGALVLLTAGTGLGLVWRKWGRSS